MRDSISIRGDFEALLELNKELKAQGIDSEICGVAMQSAEGGGFNILEIASANLAAVAFVIRAYLKHRRGRIVLEANGKTIEVEGKTTEDTERLLRSGVLCLKRLDVKKAEDGNS